MPNANNNNNNSHYYYAPPNQTNLLGSHASSQQNTNETTCDDGSPTSNTDESARYLYNQLGTLPTNNLAPSISSTGDYHHYQVVAPANGQQRPNLCLRQSTDLQATCESPCKSIQRLVSNLFQVNQSQPTNKQSQRNRKLTHCAPSSNAIPTINEALVGVEPLIRSSSWQNKTLIDLRQQQQQQHQSAVHYLESSLIQNKTMPHNGRLQQNDAEHLYCGLNTLRASEQPQRPRPSSPLAHYKTDQLNQSFHTFVDKMNERHFYQLNSSSPNFELPHLRAQLGAATLAHQSAYLRRTSSSSAIDSDLDRAGEKQRHKDKSGRHWLAYLFRASQPLCLLIGLLIMTLAALCLAVLLSNYRQHQPISASGPSSDDKDSLSEIRISQPGRQPPLDEVVDGFPLNGLPAFKGPSLGAAPSVGAAPSKVPPQIKQSSDWFAARDRLAEPVEQPVATVRMQSLAVSTQAPIMANHLLEEASTQSYWLKAEQAEFDEHCGPKQQAACSSNGRCQAGVCSCFAGFSGPICNIANCPNECSQHGDCQLRQGSAINNLGAGVPSQPASHLESLGFQTLFGSLSRNSICPNWLEADSNQSWAVTTSNEPSEPHLAVYDRRLEWRCACQRGFAGPDCSELEELSCDNERDDDDDGLVDCEDDDCCSQPVCRDNLMCFKSPEPSKVLETRPWRMALADHKDVHGGHHNKEPNEEALFGRSPAEAFFARVRFLIGNDSVQSYAQEHLFDRSRVAVVRGRLVKPTISNQLGHNDMDPTRSNSQRVIVGVRVGVVESAQLGFTLTRNDGFFDLLVNGNEWITLQYHKNAHLPIKRKLFVRPHAINLLEEDVEMWPVGSTTTTSTTTTGIAQQVDSITQRFQADLSPFDLRLHMELHKIIASTVKRDAERRRNLLFECLLDAIQQPARAVFSQINLQGPTLVDLDNKPPEQTASEPLRFIVPAGLGAFKSKLDAKAGQEQLEISYNSALFPPAASVSKSVLSIRLLGHEFVQSGLATLNAIIIQLDIEGQSRRERLDPLPALSYQFAWNRRNVYGQKVYGFSELSIRIGYEYNLKSNKSFDLIWNDCSARHHNQQQQQADNQQTSETRGALERLKSARLNKQVVWFRRKAYLEAHHLNQHSDLGKWNLISSNRFDQERQVVYFGSGWSLPYKLAYPPVLSDHIKLIPASEQDFEQPNRMVADEELPTPKQVEEIDFDRPVRRHIAKGPSSTVFVIISHEQQESQIKSSRLIQLDPSGRQRLLDVPLSILSSRFEDLTSSRRTSLEFNGNIEQTSRRLFGAATDDLQLLYNNYASTLYISSRLAGRIVQVSLSSLLVLNRTLSGGSATAAADDEISIEPLCGFGSQTLSATLPMDAIRLCRLVRLNGPHSITLDEERQLLYFVDGSRDLVALELSTNQAFLFPAASGRPSSPSGSSEPHHPTVCRRADLRRPFNEYRAHRMHSLAWNKADSSLYFIDRNLVFALRQNSILELMAVGASRGEPAADFPLPNACFREHKLGLIQALLADDSNDDLLLVHQWPSWTPNQSANDANKQAGRHYLAKLAPGIRAGPIKSAAQWVYVADLHSASATWNPLIVRLASKSLQPNKSAPINWKDQKSGQDWFNLSGQQQLASGFRQSGSRSVVPFIHLSGGLKRVDSIEIRADGSIFVLDSSAHSIRLIAPYSPNNFNLVERRDVNINRLFATSSSSSSEDLVSAQSQTSVRLKSPATTTTTTSDKQAEGRKLSLLIVQNPISGDLMEFHSSSGLQLRLTSAVGIHSEFYYRILTNNKMAEPDEDDKFDSGSQRLMLDYMSANGGLTGLTGAFIRLNKIADVSRGKEFELVRLYSGSRFVLQSILLNGQTMYEATTDYMGVLATFQRPNKEYSFEFVYDSFTYLLRDLVSKVDTTSSSMNIDLPDKRAVIYNHNSNQSRIENWRQLKRIVYDRVFYHYCDLFIVSS